MINLFGDSCEIFIDCLPELNNCVFWSFSSHESGYDTYSLNDGNGYWRRSVYWDGSSDPEGDKTEIELEWYSTMPKPILKVFSMEDAEDIYNKVKEYKLNKTESDPWSEFFKNHSDKDGLLLKLRIAKKKNRTSFLRKLQPYILNQTEAEYKKLSDFFSNTRLDRIDEDDGIKYPDLDADYTAPEELAKGMMFLKEAGDYLYIGFQMNNIRPFVDSEINVNGSRGTYATNLAEYFVWFSDSLKGRAIHISEGGKVYMDIIYHGGYFYVQNQFY